MIFGCSTTLRRNWVSRFTVKPIIRELLGAKFLLAHGDGLGPGDPGYKMLRAYSLSYSAMAICTLTSKLLVVVWKSMECKQPVLQG
jgi:UDP-2,3-diacylglucosamine pyrophosphatase LpxH